MALYLIYARNSDAFKIGYSHNPTRRLLELQTGSPENLELFAFTNINSLVQGTYSDEKRLHTLYDSKRIRGEWYKLAPMDLIEILNNWIYDPGIHYSQRTVEKFQKKDHAYISWGTKSIEEVEITDINQYEIEVKTVKIYSKNKMLAKPGTIYGLKPDEVRKKPIDALINRVTF